MGAWNITAERNTKVQAALIHDYIFIVLLTIVVSGVISFHNCEYRSLWKRYVGFIVPPLIVAAIEGFLFMSRFALSLVIDHFLHNAGERRRDDEVSKLLV